MPEKFSYQIYIFINQKIMCLPVGGITIHRALDNLKYVLPSWKQHTGTASPTSINKSVKIH